MLIDPVPTVFVLGIIRRECQRGTMMRVLLLGSAPFDLGALMHLVHPCTGWHWSA